MTSGGRPRGRSLARQGTDTIEAPIDDPVALYLDAAIALQRLPVTLDWRPSVAAHFAAISEAARLVLAYPLDDLAEAAPIFTP